jgi:hypothetical protein
MHTTQNSSKYFYIHFYQINQKITGTKATQITKIDLLGFRPGTKSHNIGKKYVFARPLAGAYVTWSPEAPDRSLELKIPHCFSSAKLFPS